MRTQNLSIGGAVCFWSLAKSTDRDIVFRGLTSQGLEEHMPEVRTRMACLRASLDEVYQPTEKGERYIIRPIKGGFAVVCELPDKAQAGNDWGTVVATATLDDLGFVTLDPCDYDKHEAILTGMRGAAGWITATSAAQSLIGIIESLGGLTVRRAGGTYWLNEDKLDRWTKVAELFEGASARTDKDGKDAMPSEISTLSVVANEEMVRAIGGSLDREITAAVETIEQELSSGELKSDACERRLLKAGKLMEKVRAYEESFGITLNALHAMLDRTANAAALATLQASASACTV